MKVVTAEQMRAIDNRAQSEFGISDDELMIEAGQAVARIALRLYDPARAVVVCGKGNNAGDGFVIARALKAQTVDARVVCLVPPDQLSGTAARAFAEMQRSKIPVHDAAQLPDRLTGNDLIIDAILGTGLSGAVRGDFADAIRAINDCAVPVLSVDVPSGVRDLAAGEQLGDAIIAETTVTIGCPKSSMLQTECLPLCGNILVERINFPPALLDDPAIRLNWADDVELRSWIPPRPPNSNKGKFGHVGIVGGSPEYAGAVILAARAALRSGCGLVTIFSPPGLNAVYKCALPEAITSIVSSRTGDTFDETSASAVLENRGRINVSAVGPGLGNPAGKTGLIHKLISEWEDPAVYDADALNALAQLQSEGRTLKFRNGEHVVLTPHPGEAARLLGTTVEEVQRDRASAARECAQRFGCNVLLKGAGTLVAQPNGRLHIVPGACSALAKGGAGDVLTGLIASLTAQGIPAWKAAVLGAHLHLKAGQTCAAESGEHGVLAGEVADAIARTMAHISS